MKNIYYITGVWVFGVLTLLAIALGNHMLPLGWDPLSYRHYMLLMQQYGDINIGDLVNHQAQFEAFFGTLGYVLGTQISVDVFLTWGYVFLIILASIAAFILGKRHHAYTLASYVGATLMLFSAVRYQVFGWGLGKEMIATFLFLLALRYYRNIAIYIILSAACVALHKLTGSMLILASIGLFFIDTHHWKKKIYLFYGAIIGIGTYIPTFTTHLLPFLGWNAGDYVGISGSSGTLFPQGYFWIFESFMLFAFAVSVTIAALRKKHISIPGIYQIMLLGIGGMLLIRVFGHSRIGAFFDLFLVLCVACSLIQAIPKKFLIFPILLQSMVWGYMLTNYYGHKPNLEYQELNTIQSLKTYVPANAHLASLSPKYQAWLLGYSGFGLDSLYSGIFDRYFAVSERRLLKNSPESLCEMLKNVDENLYIFVGRGEYSLFPHTASCLKKLQKFTDGARLYLYTPVE